MNRVGIHYTFFKGKKDYIRKVWDKIDQRFFNNCHNKMQIAK